MEGGIGRCHTPGSKWSSPGILWDLKQQKLKDFRWFQQHISDLSSFKQQKRFLPTTNNIGTPNLQGITEFSSKFWEVPTKVPFTNQILGPKHVHNISYIIYIIIYNLFIYICIYIYNCIYVCIWQSKARHLAFHIRLELHSWMIHTHSCGIVGVDS